MIPDHYAALGLRPTCEDEVIRAVYRALMRQYHPDKNPSPGAALRAEAITAAFAVLGDVEKRSNYDETRSHMMRTELAASTPPDRWKFLPAKLFTAANALGRRAVIATDARAKGLWGRVRSHANLVSEAMRSAKVGASRQRQRIKLAQVRFNASTATFQNTFVNAAGSLFSECRKLMKRETGDTMVVSFRPAQRPSLGRSVFVATILVLWLVVLVFWMKPSQTTTQAAPAVAAVKARGPQRAEAGCFWPNSSEAISRELVRQAAQLRAADRRALLTIAPRIILRTKSSLVSASGGAEELNCTAAVELILPVGTAFPDGGRAFNGKIYYSVYRQGADDPPKVTFAAADEIAMKLASLRQSPTSLSQTEVELAEAARPLVEPNLVATNTQPVVTAELQAPARPVPVSSIATPSVAQAASPRLGATKMAPTKTMPELKPVPDSGCRNYGMAWTKLLCEHKGLAALDGQLGALEAQSTARASADKRLELTRSWRRFSASRTQCRTESCLRELYLSRLKAVTGIMSGNQKKSSD